MNVLDLFSGIGGFSLGLERAGMRTVAFCEIEPFCQSILRKHWPNVPCYEDVRTLTADRLRADGIAPDLICGGFPCQDISLAGTRRGIEGSRSGLWSEYARIIGELRPRFVIVENVAALLSGPSERPGEWFGKVLGDLAAIGFDAEWHSIPASAAGAPHRRDRVWIIAYPFGQPWRVQSVSERRESRSAIANYDGKSRAVADPNCRSALGSAISWPECSPWDTEPALGRVADGLPYRLVEEELTALGNAVVPQIPEIIGRAIMTAAE